MRFSIRHIAAALALTTLPLSALHAQWAWVDQRGVRVYSDLPPPRSIPERNIFRRPGLLTNESSSGTPATPDGASPAPSGASVLNAPAPPRAGAATGQDPALAKKLAAAQEAASAAKREQDLKAQAARADNCQRARQALAQMQSGVRLATTNAQGEREFMSDETRATESQRLQGIISNDCR